MYVTFFLGSGKYIYSSLENISSISAFGRFTINFSNYSLPHPPPLKIKKNMNICNGWKRVEYRIFFSFSFIYSLIYSYVLNRLEPITL